MDFTREPIVESIITPKEGCKLVVRSSKGAGQEEYFVDAVEVVSFGHVFFLRSTERPKSFLVPATDYEIIEVRETRMVLKSAGLDRSMKVPPQREAPKVKESSKVLESRPVAVVGVGANNGISGGASASGSASVGGGSAGVNAPASASDDSKSEPKRRERKRHSRRRRFKDEIVGKEGGDDEKSGVEGKVGSSDSVKEIGAPVEPRAYIPPPPLLRAILPPPPMLISQGIAMQRKAPLTLDDEPVVGDKSELEGKLERPLKRKRKVTTSHKNDDKESVDGDVLDKVADAQVSDSLSSENLGSESLNSKKDVEDSISVRIPEEL